MQRTAVVERRAHAVVDSPVGPLTLVAVDGTLAGLYMDGQRHRPPPATFGEPATEQDAGLFTEVAAQLAAYFAGRLTEFDLPITLSGTSFQRSVWHALVTIPHGTTVTYGELAEQVGRPTAARAVGMANGRNPIGIVVPCHRVVGAAGALTGYSGGLDRKRWLLSLEQGHRRSQEEGHRDGSLPGRLAI